jgi:translocation and assembly module TamA
MIPNTRLRLEKLVVAVLVAGVACAARQRNDAPVVNSLKIEGNRRLSDKAIKQRILTGETSWIPFSGKKYFDPVVWEADQRRVQRLYESTGDYHAKVVRAEVVQRAKNQVDLVLHVSEDQPVLIERVHIAGLDALPAEERERALEDLALEPGQPFTEAAWTRAKIQIRSQLSAQGYADVDVDGQANVDVGKYQASLELRVNPGPRYHFGEITVRAPPGGRIDPALVREQVDLALGGELYSDELIDEAQRRVFAMGVFSTARVRTGEPDRTRNLVPVIAEVREGPFRTLRLGGGAGIDQVRNEGRLLGEWTHRDFLGGMRRLTAQLVVGWAFIPNTYAVLRNQLEEGPRHGPIYRAKLDFEQPRLFARPSLKLKSVLESERTLEQSYDALGGRFMNGVIWQPYSTVTIFPSYQVQGYQLNGPRTATAQAAPLALGCRTDPCFIVVSYLEQVVTWDKRDSPLEPKRGHYLTLSLQEGGGPLQGDFNYFRIVPEARGYVTMGEDRWLTLAARLQVGTLLPTSGNPDDSAVVTRFVAGGAMSMRGYSLRRLSPMLLAPAPTTSGAATGPLLTLPIGGNGSIEGNLEGRTNVSDNIAVALFTDFGTVTRDSLGAEAMRSLQWAAGFGLRFITPVGPIRLDLAYRLPFGRPPPLFDPMGREITYRRVGDGTMELGRESGANVNKSCFGIGGSSATTWVKDGLCVFHISIGEAF